MKSLGLAGTFLVLALALLGVSVYFRAVDQNRLEDRRRENCLAIEQLKTIQRDALSEDILATKRFLAENSQGLPGISPEVIRAGIARDERQLRDLVPQEC